MRRLTSSPQLYWLLQALGWSLYGLMGLVLIVVFGKFAPLLPAIEFIVAGTMLGVSHLLRLYMRRYRWAQLPLGRLLPRLVLANAAVTVGGLAFIAGFIWLLLALNPAARAGQNFHWVQYIGYAINIFFTMCLWLAVYFGLHYFDNFRSAEIDTWKLAATAREAELRMLQAQLNPHFLFNGLNNIRALVMEDPARARTMMTHLAELLRYSMQRNTTEQVPLATELEIVANYLQLEAMQLEERLHVHLDVAPATLPVLLPPLSLQLLVENAIKHGLAPRPAGGRLSLHAQLDAAGTALCVAVRNTGTYQPQPDHPGLGLRNVQERLRLLCGGAARLTIGPDPLLPDTVLAELYLPVSTNQPPTHERLTY